MSETKRTAMTAQDDEFKNADVEEVVCEWDSDRPDQRSDAAAEIVEDAFRTNEGRNVLATFSRSDNGEPVFTIVDLPAGRTAKEIRAGRDGKKRTLALFAESIRKVTMEELDELLAIIQAERTSRLSSKSKAAKRADRKKRAAKRKQEKAERKTAASAVADDWKF